MDFGLIIEAYGPRYRVHGINILPINRINISRAIPVRPKTIKPMITTSDNKNFAASQIIQPIPADAATISAATSTV